jgi:hypothetical protein
LGAGEKEKDDKDAKPGKKSRVKFRSFGRHG